MQASSAHIASPFDLHVLSTPPAFILSQDQTLNKKFSSGQIKPSGFSLTEYCCLVRFCSKLASEFSSEPRPFGLYSLEFSGLHCCLFVKVLCFVLFRRNSDIIPWVCVFVKHFFKNIFYILKTFFTAFSGGRFTL